MSAKLGDEAGKSEEQVASRRHAGLSAAVDVTGPSATTAVSSDLDTGPRLSTDMATATTASTTT